MAENIIYNSAKLSRPVSFAGLPHVGTKSPTDIDAPDIPFVLEAGAERKYLIGDFKESGKQIPDGQRILLERHVSAFAAQGYHAVAFLAWHSPHDTVIDAASTVVVRWFNGTWHEDDRRETLLTKYRRFFLIQMDSEATQEICPVCGFERTLTGCVCDAFNDAI